MIDNKELMFYRGEYLTLQTELKQVRDRIAELVDRNSYAMSFLRSLNGDFFNAGSRKPLSEIEESIHRFKMIQELQKQAEDLTHRLRELKPLARL